MKLFAGLLIVLALLVLSHGSLLAQPAGIPEDEQAAVDKSVAAPPHQPIDVNPQASDVRISERISKILSATGWYEALQVDVSEGIVFLRGICESEQKREWAESIAQRTEDVVAVVNVLEVSEPSAWNLKPARDEARELWRGFLRGVPWVALAAAIFIVTSFGARGAKLVTTKLAARRVSAPLLVQVVARLAYLAVFLLGIYLVLRIAGLTRLALTLVGGTGLLGLILGIAFRDITENFLASLILSIYRPFRPGDLIEVSGETGYVQMLNTRSTILMTLSGNHLQIPNTTMFKSMIRNYSTNPNRVEIFTIGIGYDDPIPRAQELAMEVLQRHPAVLNEPEPAVLVDNLGPSTVNLKVYFWLNGQEHSWIKVRSSVIRLVKSTFQENKITMPDEARELVFPRGVPLYFQEPPGRSDVARNPDESVAEPVAVDAEGDLDTEAGELSEQARRARRPEEGTAELNLEAPPDEQR